jgi:hypothetical protein
MGITCHVFAFCYSLEFSAVYISTRLQESIWLNWHCSNLHIRLAVLEERAPLQESPVLPVSVCHPA